MSARTAQAHTYVEPELLVKMESACKESGEAVSKYIRRLVLKDLIDRQRLSSEEVMELAS
jgi:hypothetical protein